METQPSRAETHIRGVVQLMYIDFNEQLTSYGPGSEMVQLSRTWTHSAINLSCMEYRFEEEKSCDETICEQTLHACFFIYKKLQSVV